jgi:trigger factor
MSYTATYKKLDGEAEFTGEIAGEKFDSYRSHALEHLGANLEVPGFRKGKAPESVIEKNVPEMAILEEMANHAIMDVYPKLLEEHKVQAIGSPAVQITKIARNNPLGFVIRTAIMPEVELPDYKKIAKKEHREETIEVTDEEFEKALIEIRQMRARGIKENQERENMEKGIANPEPAEKKEGEAAAEEPLPELTDEYVKTLGNVENVEDFKAKFRENMRLEKENRAREANRLNIMEKILEETKTVIPKILVDAEIDRMTYRMRMDISGMGLSYDDYMKHLGKSEAEMREEFRSDAEKRVKMELLIAEIAKAEKLEPNAEETEKQVEEIMRGYPGADKERAKAYVEQIQINEQVFKLLEGK